MSAWLNTRMFPRRSTPRASINTSVDSPPWAPAFKRRAPPTDPGMPT